MGIHAAEEKGAACVLEQCCLDIQHLIQFLKNPKKKGKSIRPLSLGGKKHKTKVNLNI